MPATKVHSFLQQLLLSSLLFAIAGGCAPEEEPAPNGGLSQITQPLTLSPVSSYTNSASTVLANVNGRKTVGSTQGLHTVWALGNMIRYSNSVDGISWSTAEVVNPAPTLAAMPAIAVASDGTVGIVYVRLATASANGGDIYFRTRSPGGVWNSAFKVTSDTFSTNGTTPSIAIHNNTVHVAWAKGSGPFYASFPITQMSASGTASFAGVGSPICALTTILYPSIAVANGASGADPVVRIAWAQYESPNDPSCEQTYFSGLFVKQKTVTANTVSWSTVMDFSGTSDGTGSTKSLSLAANPATGDFYLAISRGAGGNFGTVLYHQNALVQGSPWQSFPILSQRAIVDVVAKTRGCEKLFRIVFTELSQSTSLYGPTSYWSGTWTGSSAAPTWRAPLPTLMSSMGRAGSASLWMSLVGPTSARDVYSLFETPTPSSNTYALMDAYDITSIPGCSAAPPVLGPN